MHRILKSAMVKHGLKNKDLCRIIGVTENSLSNKMNNKTDFKASEMIKTIEHFKSLGETYTIDYLFFGIVSSIKDK